MRYISTRDKGNVKTASQAILQGIGEDGGLFVPLELPTFSQEELLRMCALDYAGRAEQVLAKFLGDFTAEEITGCVRAAYTGGRFEEELPAPLSRLGEDCYLLELWHGPTCAFKDIALQLLPGLMTVSARKNAVKDELVILVATSGDTGKAALEGFAGVPGTRVLVFYPQDGVSAMQKHQMRAQEGENVCVCAIEGNFDDAQTGVKRIFTDKAFAGRMEKAGKRFSSANSINFGRLLPQIVYYVGAYCDLVRDEELAFGEPLNVVVPTGNFGNILAAYYAKQMGVPLGKLVCASNRNNVLSDFLESGVYDRNRGFYTTLSPSMDILISSNLERLLFELCGRDERQVSALMAQLQEEGRYTISAPMRAALRKDFTGGFCGDDETRTVIRSVYERYSYLLDPHTAVAFGVYEKVLPQLEGKTVVVSTASPYKFAGSVCEALGLPAAGEGLFADIDALHAATGTAVPAPLSRLRTKEARFFDSCPAGEMPAYCARQMGL
ncbi:MAG: threonine synthase [Provencibacterium sp.]|jgi:threonine synthase|nr:threonine synthase [Provencibacterium sp.]